MEKKKLKIELTEFHDEDGDYQLSTLIEVQSKGFLSINKSEHLFNNENWYNGVNKNRNLDLNKFDLKVHFKKGVEYKIRAKVRDSSLGWSKFSEFMVIKL